MEESTSGGWCCRPSVKGVFVVKDFIPCVEHTKTQTLGILMISEFGKTSKMSRQIVKLQLVAVVAFF